MTGTQQISERKRRPRRIAADEAHAWARNLRLGNPYAKLVLSMLTLYVNGDGACFVGAAALAEDCELAVETVRRRISWLESIGAIVRLPQWIDENGHRTSDGKGRRTSDEIRLLLDGDMDEIEQRANGDGGDSDKVNTPHGRGQSEAEGESQESVSIPLGVGLPTSCGGGLISEPEPELEDSPPTPPPGGSDDGWQDFEKDWSEPILRQSVARQVWSSLTVPEKAFARKAARGYVAWRKAQRKPPNVINAHTFLREREAWPQFAERAPEIKEEAKPVFEEIGSENWRARCIIAIISGEEPPQALPHRSAGNGRYFSSALSAAKLALARFADENPETWPIAAEGTQQCGSWKQFLGIGPRLITVGRKRREIAPGQWVDDWPIKEEGLRVPCPWPPGKDGKIYSTGPPETLMTEQDEADLDRLKA